MSAQLKFTPTSLHPTEYSIDLRQQVERLERLREDACMHRDRDAVELIDKQIKQATAEWIDSFTVEVEERFRKTA